MAVITIPFDYDPDIYGDSLIPIYLNDTDENGRPVFFGWIEAVIPVQDKLRALTRRVLGDVWRVSELTDVTVQHLWRKYGDNIGPYPSHKVYRTARRKAHGMEDPGAREHLGRNLSLDRLDQFRRDSLLSGGLDTESAIQRELSLKGFEEKLKKLGSRTDHESFVLLKSGYSWREIGRQVGENPNTLYRRFRRLIDRINGVV